MRRSAPSRIIPYREIAVNPALRFPGDRPPKCWRLTAPSKHFREVLVDVEQARVGLCVEVDVDQGHDRLKTLRVDHRPLLERERSRIEDEREMRGSTTPRRPELSARRLQRRHPRDEA
ncbi:MAG TPA: hypothetical protein VJY34_18950 [Roseiarcus sp.]|nr:hypothetical protein [Roseiarcus sp.]